jgi:S1-C subfamily serine protease
LKNTLIAGEKVPHPYIGVQMMNLTADLARQNNRNPNSPFIVAEVDGILVMRVLPSTPAERAGIRRGDVIVTVDDRPITDGAKLQAMVEKAGLNRPLKLGILRGDRRINLTVQTAQLQSPNS